MEEGHFDEITSAALVTKKKNKGLPVVPKDTVMKVLSNFCIRIWLKVPSFDGSSLVSKGRWEFYANSARLSMESGPSLDAPVLSQVVWVFFKGQRLARRTMFKRLLLLYTVMIHLEEDQITVFHAWRSLETGATATVSRQWKLTKFTKAVFVTRTVVISVNAWQAAVRTLWTTYSIQSISVSTWTINPLKL
jgi:hypothetical protein